MMVEGGNGCIHILGLLFAIHTASLCCCVFFMIPPGLMYSYVSLSFDQTAGDEKEEP